MRTIFVTCDQNSLYYPRNQPNHFKVHLERPIRGKIALAEIHATGERRESLLVQCKELEATDVFGRSAPVLRRVGPSKKNTWTNAYGHPYFVNLKSNSPIRELEFIITDDEGSPVTTLRTIKLTLWTMS